MLRFSLTLLAAVAVVLVVLWVTGILSWSGESKPGTGVTPQVQDDRPAAKLERPYQVQKATVFVSDTSQQAILPDPIVVTDATLAPVQEAEVPSRVDGQLTNLYVRLGSEVLAGDLIGQLDDTVIRPEMEKAKVQAESTAAIEAAKLIRDYWELEFRKAQEVNRSVPNAVALLEIRLKEVQRDRYEREWMLKVDENVIARHEYALKRRQWELHQIRSPISGEVIKLYKRAGEGVRAGETVVRVANFDRLYVEGAIPLPLRHMVRPGMRVLVEPERQRGWLKELRGHTATVTGVSLTSDGRFLVSSGEDGRVVVWDWQFSAQRPWELRDDKFSREYGCVACSPVLERRGHATSYTILAGAADGRIRIWTLEVSEHGQILKRSLAVLGEVNAIHRTPIRCLAVSPDGKLVASGSEDGDIYVSSLETRQPLLKLVDPSAVREPAHRAAVTSLAFLPEGDLVSASLDRSLARWQIGQDGQGNWANSLLWRTSGRSGDVIQLGVSRDGQRALFENGEELRILDLRDGRTLSVISSRRSGHFRSVALFSPDGRQVLTTTAGGRLHLWNVPPTHEESAWFRRAYQRGFKYHTPMILGVFNASLVPNGAALLPAWLAVSHPVIAKSSSPDDLPIGDKPQPAVEQNTVIQIPELWPVDARELRLYSMSDPSSVTCAAFSPDGRFCVTGGSDKVIRVWPTPSIEETTRPLEGVMVYVGQQVEGGGGLVRIRAELENPRHRSARLEMGIRVTLTVLPDFRP